MILGKIKYVYNLLDKINPHIKTCIILILICFIIGTGFLGYTKRIIENSFLSELNNKKIAEEYTDVVAPMINYYVLNILQADLDASNVLLLNYHNSLTSSHGLSYKYLTSITEKRRGIETKNCLRIWHELEYIYYEDEIERINSSHSLIMDSITNYRYTLPNMVELLEMSNAKSAAFYPIIGVSGIVGMLVIIYPEEKIYDTDYYSRVIAKLILPLSSLLDYDNMKVLFNKLPREEFKKMYKN